MTEPRGPNRFKKRELTRAVAALKGAGLKVTHVEIGQDGKLLLRTAEPGDASGVTGPDEVENWLSKQKQRSG
jgi:hypothetical protein